MEKNTKQYENLRRDISSHLREFERNREWADFSNWLHRLLEALGTKKYPELPQQVNLCKRLAQCLNPSLPAGVHTTALKVYQIILQNFSKKSELLALTALGLLPFFEHSNATNKGTVLRIFDTYFVSDVEGIQMIVGLMNALLTVLNQSSQELAKKLYAICDKISSNYGKIWVDGAVWINILKSPKVRLAGFKYFTKVFRERDRGLQGQAQKNMEQEKVKKQVQQIEKSIETSELREQQKYLLTSIYCYINVPDTPNFRFPNFPTLVLNALSVCLDSPDNMIKRAALDLLGTHLKLNSGVFAKQEGIILMEKMVLLLQTKEYSLTNRVYKYLFDQPNSEGVFNIDKNKKTYQLQVLREAIANLLTPKTQKNSQNVLVIIEILIGDHQALAQFLLQALAHQIVTFAEKMQKQYKKQSYLTKNVTDFYLRAIFPRRKLFISALLSNIPRLNQSQIDPLAPNFSRTLDGLRFYFNRLQKIVASGRKMSGNMQQIQEKRIDETKESIEYLSIRVQTLQKLVSYLYDFRPYQENEALVVLDLCNQLLTEIQIQCDSKEEGISSLEVDKILAMLAQEGEFKRKNIYARLLTLLPKPKKELLLPYIQDNALSIVCINLILGGDRPVKETSSRTKVSSAAKNYRSISSRSGSINSPSNQPIALQQQEQKKVFFAIFKLLNCHLFQNKALQFIQRFKTWWGEIFVQFIDRVQPSQWLIYWKRLQGDVAGGVVRMIQNLECLNSYHQHLSRKWLKESQSIVSKVLEPIYALLQRRSKRKDSIEEEQTGNFKEWNIAEYQNIYNLLKLVFKFTSKDFVKFFYLQKDKYLAPFILFIFKCLQNNSFSVKSKSLSMLTFILTQAELTEQKIVFVSLTLPNVLAILDTTITKKKELEGKIFDLSQTDIEKSQASRVEIIREELVIWDNLQIEMLQYVGLCIKRVSEIGKSQTKAEQLAIICLRDCNLLDVVMKGIVFTQTYYIKRFYIQISKDLASLLSQIDKGKTEISLMIEHILDKLLILLKNSDLNKLEQIIKNRNDTGPKDSFTKRKQEEPLLDVYLSFAKESIPQNQIKENLNLEEKYSEIIELWNTVKFYLNEAVKLQIKKIPTIQLLSLVLKTFPLSYLKYAPVGSEQHTNNLEELEGEVGKETGLKKEVFQIFEIIWSKQSKEILDFLIEKSDPRILIHSQLDPSKVLQTFLKATKIKEVSKYLKSQKFALPKNMLHYNLQNLLAQNQLMLFIYLYLLYCNLKLLKNTNRIKSFMDSLIDLTELMKTSPHVQTKLWLLELIDLIAQRMLSSKDLYSEGGAKFKDKLQHLTKELIDQLEPIINKSKKFTRRRTQAKSGLFSLFTKQEKQTSYYDFVKVFPPTIFQHFQKYQQASKKSQEMGAIKKLERKGYAEQPRQRVSQYLLEQQQITLQKENKIQQFLFGKFVNRREEEFVQYLSLCSLLTLIRIGNSVLTHLYDREMNKVSLILKELLQNILPSSESKQNPNLHINQLIAQYLQTLLDHESIRPDTIKNSRKNIIEIYMKDDFFKCTQPTLGHWRKIIDYCTQSQDLLGELLSKQGLFEGIFTRKAEGIRLKIKSFERVCFVIWAGKVDKYEHKLRIVLQSINEVMKQQQAPPALLILVLFCIRILLMRLSVITLNKIFKSVWPSLITLLIQIFKKDKTQKNPNLLLAALKVIELVHALQIQDFILHRWIFLFDYFGIKLDPIGEIDDNLTQCDMLSPFVFKPFVVSCLPNIRLRCKFLPEKTDNEFLMRGIHKRKLIVKKSFVESEEEVKENGLLLMQYMMDLNECRAEIEKAEIDRVIEEDFITLDDYIFQVR